MSYNRNRARQLTTKLLADDNTIPYTKIQKIIQKRTGDTVPLGTICRWKGIINSGEELPVSGEDTLYLQVAKLLEEYPNGLTTPEIANIIGLTSKQVRNAIKNIELYPEVTGIKIKKKISLNHYPSKCYIPIYC